ncbi:HAD family hydrolase [Paenibacillus sp. UNC451MF]|uniref:HAD family hydrolase n=1 Tax=Paenibacillus sp. UNC451MF TaxID=1449063 RepID=UPI00048BD350|nr:HAD family hydrolase [Paenibacillus sp. UNC451MF]
MMKKWITFDLDGTLMQNPFGKWVFPAIEERISKQLQQPFKSTEALVREHELRMQQNRTVEAYDWDDMVQQLLKELQLELDINVEQLVLDHSVTPKIFLLEENVTSVLKQLKEKGYSLATVTNGFYKYQYPVMQQLGLSEWFDEIITPEKAGCGKPDVNILRELQRSGQIVAHVGDRLDHDVYLSNKSGIPSVLIYHKLPESLKAYRPKERAETTEFMGICEKKLKAENSHVDMNPYPSEYVPSYVLYRMEELLECV